MVDDDDVSPSVVRMHEPEIVFVPRDGHLVPAYECSLAETSLSCSEDGEFAFSISSWEWLRYPLPEGKVVDATPYGWWVVQGEQAVPADVTATQYAAGPVSMDVFIATVDHRETPWPQGGVLGIGYEFIWAAVALVGIAGGALVHWRRAGSERRA